MALNSDNIIVRTITKVGLNGTHSIMGGNWRHLRSKYGMKECYVMKSWDEKCKNEGESLRVCKQIRDMCSSGGIGVTWLCLIRRNVGQLLNFYVEV